MIRQMKDLSVHDEEHGEIVAVHDFLSVLEEEFRKYGVTFEHGDLMNQEFMHTDEAILLAADILKSSALAKMEKRGFTAMLPCHA